MKYRKRTHKNTCNNVKRKEYKFKVYQYIRANTGFENWKFEILETALFENKTALRIREQHYKNLLNPSLNTCNAYQSKEERQLYKKKQSKTQLAQKITCDCGGRTDKNHKARHEKTNQHQKYLKTINNIQNITINITNLNITI